MKTKLLLSVALAAIVASPVMAASARQNGKATAYSSQSMHRTQAAHGAYANEPMYAGPDGTYANGVVVSGNRIVGQDPDPNVRLELRRDPIADY